MTLRGEWSRRAMAAASMLALATVATFAGPSLARADECANAAFRTGPSAALPDCRAFEQVTPVDKEGAEPSNTNSDYGTVVAGSTGSVLFRTLGVFGDAQSFPFAAPYVGTRAQDGWSTTAVDVAKITPDAIDDGPNTAAVSADQRRAVVISSAALTPGAIDGGSNIYLETLGDGARSLALIAAKPGSALYLDRGNVRVLGGTSDFSSLVLSSPYDLTNNSDDRGPSRLYRLTSGVLTPLATNVDTLPSGPDGTIRPLSTDAARLTFRSDGSVYQTLGTTARVVSHSSGQPATAANGSSPAASPDGRSVVFVSTQALTAKSRAGSASVYRWTDGTVVDLLADARSRDGAPLVSLSDLTVRSWSADGTAVWFTSSAQVLPDGPADGGLYLLDTPTGTVVLVAPIAPGADPRFRFSADGNAAAIVNRQGDSRDVRPCDAPDGCGDQLFATRFVRDPGYVYASLTCVTCGFRGAGPVAIGTEATTAVLNDGRIFFDSPARLEPLRDFNASADVYEYDPSVPSIQSGNVGALLLSAGRGGTNTYFGGASLDGRDVFLNTQDQLVGQDTDTLLDIYDVRVDGGLASQQQPPARVEPCAGDACKPPATVPAPSGTAASSGDVPPAPAGSPAFTVGTPSRAALRTLARTGRLGLRVRVGTAGTISSRLQATIGGRLRGVGSRTTKTTRAQTVTVALRLSKAARRQLARRGRLTVALTVAYSERTAPVRKTLRLIRFNPKGGRR